MRLYIRVSEEDTVSKIMEPLAQYEWKMLSDTVADLLLEKANNGEGPWYASPNADSRSFCWCVEVNDPTVIVEELRQIGKRNNLSFTIDVATEF